VYEIKLAEEIYNKQLSYKKNVSEYDSHNNHILSDEQMNDILNEIDKSDILTIPDEYLEFNMSQSKEIIEYIISRNYTDFIGDLSLDNFQIMCLHAGLSANIRITDETCIISVNECNDTFMVNDLMCDDFYERYCGKVYCCTVPNEGIIYVRRHGVPVWCGNSRHG